MFGQYGSAGSAAVMSIPLVGPLIAAYNYFTGSSEDSGETIDIPPGSPILTEEEYNWFAVQDQIKRQNTQARADSAQQMVMPPGYPQPTYTPTAYGPGSSFDPQAAAQAAYQKQLERQASGMRTATVVTAGIVGVGLLILVSSLRRTR